MKLARWSDLLPALMGAWLVFAVLGTWWLRVGHGYDLEWMEGGMLGHAWRLQRGLPLYPEAGPDWVPYVYPPGYSATLAAVGKVFGLSYPQGRVLSMLGTLAAAAALAHGVASLAEGERRWGPQAGLVGLVTALCFLGSYRASGAFFDLVRPDALAMGLLAWSVAMVLDGRRGAHVAAGLLLCAAFMVKHNMAAFGVPLALGAWAWRGWRPALIFGLTAAAPALAFTVFEQVRTEGHFLTYLIEVPSSHPLVLARGVPGTPGEIGYWMFPMVALCGLGLAVSAPRQARRDMLPELHWGLALVVALGAGVWSVLQPDVQGSATPHASVLFGTFFALGALAGAGAVAMVAGLMTRRFDGPWLTVSGVVAMGVFLASLMRAHHGGFVNVLIPAHWALCLGGGAVVVWSREVWARPGVVVLGALALSCQLGWLIYLTDLAPLWPTAEDRVAGAQVHEALERCDGPILAPYAVWFGVEAGQAPGPHLIALWDIDHPEGPFRRQVAEIKRAVKQRRWACVLDGGNKPLGFGIPAAYPQRQRLPLVGRALMPRTGWRVRPTAVLRPKGR